MAWKSQQTRKQEQQHFPHEWNIYGKISQSLQLIYEVTGFLCVLQFSGDYLFIYYLSIWASQVAFVVKNLPAYAGDVHSIPGSGSSLQ